jgi:hypothetical protein
MGMTKRELIDMFKNEIFPSQARHLKNVNYEGKGEVDEQEYLRDTAILIDLAEKGLDYENRLKADLKAILVELQLKIEELDSRAGYDGNGMPTFSTDYIRKKKVNELIQQKINELKADKGGKNDKWRNDTESF